MSNDTQDAEDAEEVREPNLLLRRQREMRGWSQKRVALELQQMDSTAAVTEKDVARWERGKRRPGPYYREKLCLLFGVSVYELGFVGPEPELPPRADQQQFVVLRREEAEVVSRLLNLGGDAMRSFDPSRRAALREIMRKTAQISGAAGAIALVDSPLVDPETWERLVVAHTKTSALNSATLNRFEHLLGDCWELSNQNELEASEDILSSFLPKILALAPHDVNSRIAYLASQGLRLQSVLVHHHSQASNKILICQQAVDYARHADDPNTLVTALIELAVAFKFEGRFEKRLSTLQEALGYSVHASPLVQSRAYSNNASALAESGRIHEAQLYIQLAQDVFPDDPVSDPGFALSDSNIFTLSYHAGKVYTYAGNSTEAFDAFELYKKRSPDISIPERIRLEIVNAQSRTAIQASNLERYAKFFESAITGAITLGSKKRFDEAITIFRREVPKTWLANGHIKGMVEKYRLERIG